MSETKFDYKTNEQTFEMLQSPFPIQSVKWRAGATNSDKTKAIALAYIDARDVMQRLDDVLGAHGWQNTHTVEGGAYICSIGVRTSEGWLWKANGAGETNFDGVKGGLSDSFKRAAVLWGIGRYLYDLPNVWVECEKKGNSVILKDTPHLPAWACPQWSKAQRDAVLNNAPSVDPENSEKFLEATGYTPQAHIENIIRFAKNYQGKIDAGKPKPEALKFARDDTP